MKSENLHDNKYYASNKCNCIHCLWTIEPHHSSLTDYVADWLSLNAEPIKGSLRFRMRSTEPPNNIYPQSPLPSPTAREGGYFERLRLAQPDSVNAIHEELSIYEQEMPRHFAAPLVYHACHFSPRENVGSGGRLCLKEHEDKLVFSWQPTNLQTKAPPVPNGQRMSLHHSSKARRAIIECANAMKRRYKGQMSFITLTYKFSVCQKQSKRHIDSFIKRLGRLHRTKTNTFVWVAELQARGVIHYHLLTPFYTDKDWLREAWSDIIKQDVYPDVGGIKRAFSYMAKYIAKNEKPEPIIGRRWACSRNVSKWRKPLEVYTEDMSWNDFDELRGEMYRDHDKYHPTEWGWIREKDDEEVRKTLAKVLDSTYL